MSGLPRLYFVVRADISEGRRAAQLVHAQDDWTARYGHHNGAVVVYAARNEADLLRHLPDQGRTVLFREPSLNDQATAFATDTGSMTLPLLGQHRGHNHKE